MTRSAILQLLVLVYVPLNTASATDACAALAIHTQAQVSVSDGSAFRTETWYQSPDAAAIRHVSDDDQLTAVDGPFSWTAYGADAQAGTAFHAHFALGHQFHAMLLNFDAIAANTRATPNVTILGRSYRAVTGDNPRGGLLHLLQGDDAARPVGLAIEPPGSTPIVATFHDWKDDNGMPLPYHVRIDDGDRIFDYRYGSIRVSEESPLWYFEKVPDPSIDEVQVYRLHQRLLAAHCLGDARMIAELTAPEAIFASRGQLLHESRESVQTQFTGLFGRLSYSGYKDLEWPTVRIAESGDLGWVAVNVRATGKAQATGEPFDDQWAWIMTVEKVGDRWLTTGIASNQKN